MVYEIINIENVEEKVSIKNKPYLKVYTIDGRNFSCWKEELFDLLKSDNVGFNVKLRTNGSFTNIEDATLITKETGKDYDRAKSIVNDLNKTNDTIPGLSVRDNIIVAQVILKEANNFAVARHEKIVTPEDYGQVLANAVNELTAAYKLALNNLCV